MSRPGRAGCKSARSPRPSTPMRVPAARSRCARRMAGFSLVELIVVMVVLGILGASVAAFIDGPVRAWFDTLRRAQMTESADAALRRLTRELQGALPNSPRVTSAGGTVFLEFVPVIDGGRYRALPASDGSGDALDFADATDNRFDVLGPAVQVSAGSQLVVFNLGSAESDVYAGNNRRAVTSSAGSATQISFAANGTALPAESPLRRFHLVAAPVTYACTPQAGGGGQLVRISGYGFAAAQPASLTSGALASGQRALVLDHVSACSFAFGPALQHQRLLAGALALTRDGETITLQAQVALPNTP